MRPTSHRLLLAGLATLALAVSQGCGSSYSPVSPPPGGTADVTITIVGSNTNMSFSPNPGAVPVGKTVAWQNADVGTYGGGTTHNVVSDTGAFTTGPLAPGSTSAPIKMTTAGSFAYHCAIHPTMVGSLTVQ
jgi:plastocyanin